MKLRGLTLRACLGAAAATVGANGRSLGLTPGDGLGAGPSAITEALRSAQDQATGRVWQGVARVEDLESQNADLWRRNKDLENRAAAADEQVQQLEDSSATKKEERVLAQELTDLKTKEAAVEGDKSALVTSVAKIMQTNETAALNLRLANANSAKLEEERRLVQEQHALKGQVEEAAQKFKDATEAEESLQQDNLEMRKAGQAMRGQLEDLQSLISTTRAEKEHLEESAQGVSKTAATKERDDLLADASDIQKKLRDAQLNAQRLRQELQDAKRQLTEKGTTSKAEDGGAEILQTLQDENLDLRRETDAARSQATALKGQIDSIQYDKDRLITTLQSSMREADKLKQLLKRQVAEKDEEIAAKDQQLLEGARRLATIRANAANNTHHFPRSASAVAASEPVAPRLVRPQELQPQAPADDPILDMHSRVEQERKDREQMQAFARDAVAATGDESLAFGSLSLPGAPDPVAATTPAPRPAQAHELSAVDNLDPEAVAKEQRAAAVDSDSAQGDDVEQLMSQAQAAVDSPMAA